MSDPIVSLIDPGDIGGVGGFLGLRFRANRIARLRNWTLSEQFIQRHERKDYVDRFWIGEQVGKWLDAATYAGLITADQELLDRVDKILGRLALTQDSDGYPDVTARRLRNPVRAMELYEMHYILQGLLVCADLLDNDLALQMACKLGDFITTTWGPDAGQYPLVGRYPGTGHGGGEGTQILEPIVLLGIQSGDSRYVEWAEKTLAKWDEWTLAAAHEEGFSCGYTAIRQFASYEKDVHELSEPMHAHTFHMTLLGIAALYHATGKDEYRDVVSTSVDRLMDEWILLTGAMSSDERYLPREFYNPRSEVEVCPQHTWILLLAQALEWTGEARYAAEIERDLFNHLLAAQLGDGSNWSYMTPLNGRSQEPYGPNCCNASGHRILALMPTYMWGLRGNAPAVFLYSEGKGTVRPERLPPVALHQETTFPSDGEVIVRVDPEQPCRFPLHLRIPPYAENAQVRVNGEAADSVPAGEFHVVERLWSPGDTVQLHLPMDMRCQANENSVALIRGPLVYAYFHDAQPAPVVFHGRRGRFAGDVSLCLDPTRVHQFVQEEDVPEGQVGPALCVPGTVRAHRPMFASTSANSEVQGQQQLSVRLLPFVNQGSIQGEYRVFIDYQE